ncbi:tetratricopeptide repeat-containing sulfotransferase family protein [Yoonia sediminilitoris]|uniref:Tetratricopeptide repeat protein n=1 Tax=Yoonia sediminilitoris TaxID=1286148 RepID=A0A2T6KQF9_9RHOB|nr:sulfotransferase [Yoonia sediminilitoris]PUB18788.1 tetratricopeptide repeat protein [Yoonia sediminilitoris]RCW98956.1 tetratricopeptide repeat protein [Yoonia sediminilitoris]
MLKQAKDLAKTGRFREAEAIYDKLLADKRVKAPVLRAAILFHNRHTHNFRKALPPVQALLKARPDDAQSHALAAETFAHLGNLPKAKEHAAKAVEVAPQDPDVHYAASFAALQGNDFEAALTHINEGLAHDPDHRPLLVQKGWALLGGGDAAAAAAHACALLTDRPDDINLLGLYMDAARITQDDPVFASMRDDLLPRYETIGGKPLSHLLKLLGKGYNDIGDYDAAFDAFAKAKTMAPMTYDAAGYRNYVQQLCQNISRADYFGKGTADDRPVLIVGMPRSGSTLVEQVLASHAQVASLGESPALSEIAQMARLRRHNGPEMVRAIKQLPAKALQELAQRYLTGIDGQGAPRVIDKNLHNFELLGLFGAMLPKARIIHVTRDPMDTCVSCYMQPLSAWHRYTQNLDTLGHSYVHYRQLMDHWRKVLPNPVLEVAYEDVIADLEGQARRMVDFLNLAWDPACLDYHSAGQQSRTLSARQVRQPVYSTSVDRWRRYDAHLDPLKRHLARFYPDGFDG